VKIVSKQLFLTLLLGSFMTSAHADDRSKKVEGKQVTDAIVDSLYDSGRAITPWAIPSWLVKKDTTGNWTSDIAIQFNPVKRNFATQNAETDRFVSYKSYHRDAETETNPHKVYHFQLIRW
jgi:hypothetical protein